MALADALTAQGAEITQKPVTPQGQVVLATGVAGLRELSLATGREVGRGVRGQAACLNFSAPTRPQIYAEGIHVIPHLNGTTAVGATVEGIEARAENGEQLLNTMIERARILVPELRGAPVIACWAGDRPKATSRNALLATHPTRNGWFVANGGFRTGLGLAPRVGEVMADFILTGDNTHIPQAFRAPWEQAF